MASNQRSSSGVSVRSGAERESAISFSVMQPMIGAHSTGLLVRYARITAAGLMPVRSQYSFTLSQRRRLSSNAYQRFFSATSSQV